MTDGVNILLVFAVPFCVTLFALPRFSHIAMELGLVDEPNHRKTHSLPKPFVGGLAMSLGVAFGCLLFLPLTSLGGIAGGGFRGYYAGAILLVIIGFFDDYREIIPRMKFVAQIAASVLIYFFSKVSLASFGNLFGFGAVDFPSMALFVTVFATVGVINAMNMIDGLDGLAGGIALVTFTAFGILAALNNQREILLLSIALCGALVAFLRYNWHPARLFMGDAGSFFLGFSAAFISIALAQKGGDAVRPVAPLMVLAVPVADTLTVMIRRIIRGKSPFHADRAHLHHILLRLGLSVTQTTILVIAVTAAFSALAVAGTLLPIPEHYLFGVIVAWFVFNLAVSFSFGREQEDTHHEAGTPER